MIHPREALLVQQAVADAFGDPVGVRDEHALKDALARPFAAKNGIPTYPTFFNKVSALFQALLLEKPFAGANRRTALCLMVLLLQDRGYRLHFERPDLDRLMTGVELGFTTFHRITVWIKGHTVRENVGAGANRT